MFLYSGLPRHARGADGAGRRGWSLMDYVDGGGPRFSSRSAPMRARSEENRT
jgi:hypothetical protein